MTSWLFIALALFAVFAVGFRLGQRRERGRWVVRGDMLKRWAALWGVVPGDSDQETRQRMLRAARGIIGAERPLGVSEAAWPNGRCSAALAGSAISLSNAGVKQWIARPRPRSRAGP